MTSRSWRRGAAALALASSCWACESAEPPAGPDEIGPVGGALESAADYLTSRQSADGAWRSQVYGALDGDPALTAHVASVLFLVAPRDPAAHAAFDRGARHLAEAASGEGPLEGRSSFPVYTAAQASRILELAGDETAADLWLGHLRSQQLDERWGFRPIDPAYGGWGYAVGPPLGRWASANVSATVFALDAFRSAGVPEGDALYRKALAFVERSQNFAASAGLADPAFDDGGFFFAPDDPAASKAGPAGVDRHGRARLHSYGSATADGLRALLACGLAEDHPRVLAARAWLERHFAADTNPGRFNPDREALRDATYYYWASSVSQALGRLDVDEIETSAGPVRWSDALAAELVRRQRPDGSWANPFTDSKEDDPLVATPFAAAALASCRPRG